MAKMGKQESRGRRVILELMVPKVHQVLLVPVVVEWSTPGGEGQPAQTHRELNWSMKEELLEATTPTKEEELTTSACQMIPTMTWPTQQGLRATVPFMALNSGEGVEVHWMIFPPATMTTISHVPCAMLQQEEQP